MKTATGLIVHNAVFTFQEGANVVISVTDPNQLADMQTFKIDQQSSYLRYENPSSKCTNILHPMNENPDINYYHGFSPGIQGFVSQSGLICDPQAPGITLSHGIFASVASSPIIFHRKSLWAFFLTFPQFSSARHVLFHFVQKLLWITGDHVFIRSSSKYFNTEYNKKHMIEFEQKLCSWKCLDTDFSKCLNSLAQEFLRLDYFSKGIYDSLTKWIDFVALKYDIIPKISNSSIPKLKIHVNMTAVTFQCDKTVPKVQKRLSDKLLDETCTNHKELKEVIAKPWVEFNDVLFIVIFNKPHFEALPYIQLLYAKIFPYIIYCGPEILLLPKEYKVTYISYGATPDGHFPGAFNYICVSMAMQMGFKVSGYLVMGDDVLLNIYKIAHYDRHVTWYLPKEEIRIGDVLTGKQCRLGSCDSIAHWRWWEDYRSELLTAFAELEQLATTSRTFHRCYSQLVKLNGGSKRANGGYADLYYIPERLSKQFIEISQVFHHRNVFLELAVPTIIRCIENPDNIKPLPGFQDQYESRDKPWDNFDKIRGKAYIHPAKWGPIAAESLDHRTFFCHKVLPFVYDQYGRIRT